MPRKIVLLLLAAFSMLIGFSYPSVASEKEITVYVDAIELRFPDQKPIINSDNRTLVPVRFVSEALGAEVAWCEANRKVTVNHQGKRIVLEVGQRGALLDNKWIEMDTQAEILNSRAMVPLRFVSECLGAGVEWEGALREIYITTTAHPVRAFDGQPFRQETDLPTSDYLGYKLPFANEPGAKISYITVDDLPAQVGMYVIYGLEVDDEFVHVKQRSISGSTRPIPMHIKENGYLNRNRNFGDGQLGIYTYSYPLTLWGDIADGIGKADKTKVEAFAFDSINNDTVLEMLIIKNPLY